MREKEKEERKETVQGKQGKNRETGGGQAKGEGKGVPREYVRCR